LQAGFVKKRATTLKSFERVGNILIHDKKMKKITIAIMSIIVMIGCTEKNNELIESSQKDATTSINKLEYAYVDGNLKIETDSTDSAPKIEFRASDEYLATIKKIGDTPNGLRKNVSAVSSLVGKQVGVIAGTYAPTASYDVLEIFMDCEDTRNANGTEGWTGGNTVDRNVTLKLCLVPKSLFSSYKYTRYAVLSLDYGWDNMIERFFDNEDSNNQNKIILKGEVINQDKIRTKLGGGITQNKNTTLCFYVYDQDIKNGMESFPDLGIQYGVFGSTAENSRGKGWISIDDEDSKNANQCWYNWNNLARADASGWLEDAKSIIEPGQNTKIHMFRAR